MRPTDRANAVLKWRQELDHSNQAKIHAWGLQVSGGVHPAVQTKRSGRYPNAWSLTLQVNTNMVQLQARVLPAPKVLYANNVDATVDKGMWNLRGKQVSCCFPSPRPARYGPDWRTGIQLLTCSVLPSGPNPSRRLGGHLLRQVYRSGHNAVIHHIPLRHTDRPRRARSQQAAVVHRACGPQEGGEHQGGAAGSCEGQLYRGEEGGRCGEGQPGVEMRAATHLRGASWKVSWETLRQLACTPCHGRPRSEAHRQAGNSADAAGMRGCTRRSSALRSPISRVRLRTTAFH